MPNLRVVRVLVQEVGGSGGRHLRFPTGGLAYGIPLKTLMFRELVSSPETGPYAVGMPLEF